MVNEEWPLEVGGFDMDGGVETTLIHAHIDVQKCDFGEGGLRLLRRSRNWVRELGP